MKYKNTKEDAYGYSFASKLEAAVFNILMLREKAGEIKFLGCQDHVKLTDANILYIADFKAQDANSGEIFWIESKGFSTDVWRIKRRLWKHYGPGKLEIWKGSYKKPTLSEIIIPVA